jgi:hypothetical protein
MLMQQTAIDDEIASNGVSVQVPVIPLRPACQVIQDSPVAAVRPTHNRAYRCHQCGKPLFLRNSVCLNCGYAVGYDPQARTMVTLAPAEGEGSFSVESEPGLMVARCANLDTASGCNWLIRANGSGGYGGPQLQAGYCLSCSLNRTIPDQSIERNHELWRKLEMAKRRMISQLLGFRLPVETRLERPDGLCFDMLESDPGAHLVTGHEDGLITLNVEEADDAVRESLRMKLGEPYRTLLGHFRHEIGHYYWNRLVRDSEWLDGFRALFGDEQRDYQAALQRYYTDGSPPDWSLHFVTAYASAHPWEDWAETWAHYMHITDAIDTALSLGLTRDAVDLDTDPFDKADLWQPDHENSESFLAFLDAWVGLTSVCNELARSMGQPDYYPFVLPRAAVGKLQFIHELIRASAQNGRDATAGEPVSASPA